MWSADVGRIHVVGSGDEQSERRAGVWYSLSSVSHGFQIDIDIGVALGCNLEVCFGWWGIIDDRFDPSLVKVVIIFDFATDWDGCIFGDCRTDSLENQIDFGWCIDDGSDDELLDACSAESLVVP